MAYDKIITIRRRMDNCLGYVLNEEKNSLDHALSYAEDPRKAHQLVTGINCQASFCGNAGHKTSLGQTGWYSGISSHPFLRPR